MFWFCLNHLKGAFGTSETNGVGVLSVMFKTQKHRFEADFGAYSAFI
jgi:hypothetical protein